jgi:hypothetical protein
MSQQMVATSATGDSDPSTAVLAPGPVWGKYLGQPALFVDGMLFASVHAPAGQYGTGEAWEVREYQDGTAKVAEQGFFLNEAEARTYCLWVAGLDDDDDAAASGEPWWADVLRGALAVARLVAFVFALSLLLGLAFDVLVLYRELSRYVGPALQAVQQGCEAFQ